MWKMMLVGSYSLYIVYINQGIERESCTRSKTLYKVVGLGDVSPLTRTKAPYTGTLGLLASKDTDRPKLLESSIIRFVDLGHKHS